MQEALKITIGIIILILGIPIGDILAKNTREELKGGGKWFILLICLCLVGSILSLIFFDDALLFTFLFIAIVTSRSLGKGDTGKKKRSVRKK